VRFCLVTSTLTIEQYCKRWLLRKKHYEWIEYIGNLRLPLKEYPVTEILDVSIANTGEILEPEFYNAIPDCRLDLDIPFYLALSPVLYRHTPFSATKAVYWSGYPAGKIPADLAMQNPSRFSGVHIQPFHVPFSFFIIYFLTYNLNDF
jgi:hypothetical protein